MNSKDILVIAGIVIVGLCVGAGIVCANVNTPTETVTIPTISPTISPTPTVTPHPAIYYIPNEERQHADKYSIGTKIGEENPPAFTPSPK